jgi:WD40 repeat protein
MRCQFIRIMLAVSLCGTAVFSVQAEQVGPEPAPLLDHYSDPLPKDALLRLGTTRLIHDRHILGVFVAPNGKTVQAIDSQGRVCFWEVKTGKHLHGFQLEDHDKRDIGGSVALSPDRKKLATGDSDGVFFWDNATGKCLGSIVDDLPKVGRLKKLTFSPDGATLFAFAWESRQLVRLDVANVKNPEVIPLEKPTQIKGEKTEFDGLFYTDFSPDRKWFAGSSLYHQEVFIWDTATGKLVLRLPDHPKRVGRIRFSLDGKMLAATCGVGAVRVWDLPSGKLLHHFEDAGYNVAFAPNPTQLFAKKGEKDFRIFDLKTGKSVLRTFDNQDRSTGHLSRDEDFFISPDGKILATFASIQADPWSVDSERLILYDIDSGKLLGLGHDAPLPVARSGAMYAADSRSIFLTNRNIAYPKLFCCQYALPSGKLVAKFEGELQKTASGGMKLATLEGDQLRLFALPGGNMLWQLKVPTYEPVQVLSADGSKLVLRREKDTLEVLDPTTGKTVSAYPSLSYKHAGHGFIAPFQYSSIVCSGDFRFTASVKWKEATVQLKEWKTGKILHEFTDLSIKHSYDLIFSPDGEYLLAIEYTGKAISDSLDLQKLTLWHVPSGHKVDAVPAGAFAGFSPDGKVLAVKTPDAVSLWDIRKAQILGTMPPLWGFDRQVAFSRDGKMAAVKKKNGVTVHEVVTGQLLYTFAEEYSWIHKVLFAPDSRSLMTVCDTSALIWDLTGQRLSLGTKTTSLAPREFLQHWKKLGTAGAAEAHQTIWKLVAAGDGTVAELEKILFPAVPADAAMVKQLVADLGSNKLKIRDSATKKLLALEAALPLLRQEVPKADSPETWLRLKKIIAQLEMLAACPDQLRQYRAVQTLEYIGTPRAEELLQHLAGGCPGLLLTREAKISLCRLANGPEGEKGTPLDITN